MAADDPVQDAIDELYAIDPDEFMERRTALATQARSTDKAAAKSITALRKPTRSAYALNRLVRSDPDAAQRLADLGEQLVAAQDSLDGPRMRELSTLRRGLVEELADEAFGAAEVRSAPPALRDEVVSTLNAAVADQSVVGQLRTGTLLRSARWDGFGFASPPELSVVRPAPPSKPRAEPPARAKPKASDRRTGATGAARAEARELAQTRAKDTAIDTAKGVAKEAKAAAKAEEQRRRTGLAQAQRTVREADTGLAKATKAEDEQHTRVRLLHEQLTDARRRLDEFRIDVRRAENRVRKSQAALERQEKRGR